MPKSYFANKQTTWVKDDRERDYRVADRDRRVTFKPNRHGGKKEYDKRDWRNAIREHLQDEDVDMGASSGSGRYNYNKKFNKQGKKGRRGSPVPNGKWKLMESPTGWYKVSIPHGEKFEKAFLLKILHERIAPVAFNPVAWQPVGTTSTFYLDDLKVAEKLHGLDKQIQLPSGFKIFVRVMPGSPNVDMNAAIKQNMKEVMAKRYNALTKALDLSKFHADPGLQGHFCALFKPIVFLTVIEIIAENIPEIEALNLFDNKISVLSFFKKSMKKLPNLKILHMGNNKLRDICQLDSLQGLPIMDLVLDGNPLCDKFKDQASYIRWIPLGYPVKELERGNIAVDSASAALVQRLSVLLKLSHIYRQQCFKPHCYVTILIPLTVFESLMWKYHLLLAATNIMALLLFIILSLNGLSIYQTSIL